MTQQILTAQERSAFALRSLYRRYGYAPYKMNRFEAYDLYVQNKDFLVSDQIITFSDRQGKLLAMKPDVTLSIVKNAPQTPGVVQKVYYNENVYRDFREIMQTGLECVGDLGGYEIAEVVLLAAMSMAALGGRWILNLSHMGLVCSVLEGLSPQNRLEAQQCLRQKNLHGLRQLCADNPQTLEKLEMLVCTRGGREALDALAPMMTAPAEQSALQELRLLLDILDSACCAEGVGLDFSVGSSLSYYSGVVFSGYLEGVPSPVLSGGQYDRLPEKMGRKAKAIGFAVYLDLLPNPDGAGISVDTLILHDPDADPAKLMAAAEEAAKSGSVLVTRQIPPGCCPGTMIRFGKEGL